ncbi:DNRLRE domain-containing protein [Streptomyces sp. NPDC005648]|uniref:DNRLRE domain-containing protein n=1 Tax=Streptomyces sp. NPDC005648 TaxID=3157044 RepID=UPI0033B2A7AF
MTATAFADGATHSTSAAAATSEPDTGSALAAARERGSRVEVTGKRTETSTTWANPSGTLTTDVYDAPIRVRKDGAWTPVNTTLADTGTAVTPDATPAELHFSDGGSGPFAELQDGAKSLSLSLGKDLPAPELEGNIATYGDAAAGGDLLVTALPSGFSEQVILHKRPDGPLTIRIPLTTSGGLKVSQNEAGHLLLTDATGKTVADAPAPHMWDSSLNATSGLPAHDTKVESKIEDTSSGQVLVLTPDSGFLDSTKVTYPLTIDPTTTLAVTTDTWLEDPNYTDSQRSSGELRVGTYDGGTHRARAFLKFDTSEFTGTHIVDTDLKLYSYWSSTCSTAGSGVRVRRITSDWDPSAITWSAMPTVTSAGEVVNKGAHGYSSSDCPAAYSHWDIDGIVQAWADGAPNYGLQLRAVDETDSLTWRRYRSANYIAGDDSVEPHLSVTYEEAELAGITDSASLSTPVVSSGTVQKADGTAVAGADVVLYAWPDNETDAALQEGDSVKLQPVAKAIADSSGNYTLRLASADLAAPEAASDGTVNFETVAYSGDDEATFNFPRKLVGSGTATAYLAATTTNPDTDSSMSSADTQTPVSATLVLESAPVTTSDTDETSATAEDTTDTPVSVSDSPDSADPSAADDAAAAASAADTSDSAGVAKACTGTLTKDLGPKWVIVGQTYSATTGVQHTLSYTKGASSSLGVGSSITGAYGSFDASGSVSKESTVTNDYPTYGNHKGVYYKSEYDYGKYKMACVSGGHGSVITYHYEVRARYYYGGEKIVSASTPKATTCAQYPKDAKFTRTTSKAVTWTDGASTGDAIGINLSAETGYSSETTVVYTFKANRYICGTGGAPGSQHPYNFVATTTVRGYKP